MFGRHSGPGWIPTGFIAYCLIYALVYFMKVRHLSKKRQLGFSALYLSIVLIIDATIFPIPYNSVAFEHIIAKHAFRYNLLPFVRMVESLKNFHKSTLFEVVANIGLFVPLGASLRVWWPRLPKYKLVLTGFLFSLTIELVQLVSLYQGLNVRIFDVDDLILNTIGTAVGVFMAHVMLKKKEGESH